MSDEKPGGPDASVRQPLPPEVPAPRAGEGAPGQSPQEGDAAGKEWWRAPSGPPPAAQPSGDWAQGARHGGPEEQDAGPFWQGEQVRDELRDAWATHGSEGIEAAHAIGAHIGDAIASHLPNPEAAAAQRGLDIRWLRLKYTLPALALSLLATWRGETPLGHLGTSLATGGIFTLLGYAMALTIPLLFLTVLPARTVAITVLGVVSAWLLKGLSWAFGWAWRAPVLGYLLRLVVAVALCSTALLILRVLGRALITILTGV